ncbi:MAG: SpoVA/SpoVAEb family sporulation membrane protein [Lachnospiraceae bacterium]|nr:SpoVA/SpoVAEb family sporulation membrane protein [Lachnospira sp.]MBQ8730911.1 SpoVA/SpoVAEb family sporulation membrane protein [Lachnospiraceae bacterium]
MGNLLDEKRNEEYGKYVEKVTKKNNLLIACIKAFFVGGAICAGAEIVIEIFEGNGVDRETASAYTTLILIFLANVLTGLNIYQKITVFAGAGSLVPITGFANSVVSAAIEYKKEGQVFGIGCKIFTIAGPVILYGIFFSWLLGLGYWLLNVMEVM